MRIRLLRRINLGNYEHYELEVEDEFNTWDEGLAEMVKRIRQAEASLIGSEQKINAKKV